MESSEFLTLFIRQVRQSLKVAGYKAGRISQLIKATRPAARHGSGDCAAGSTCEQEPEVESMGEQEKEAFLEEEKTEEMTMGNYRDKASLAGEDDQQAESVKSKVVVDGIVEDHLERFNKELEQFLDALEAFLDALESSSAATAHCGVPKVKQERKRKKFCQKTSKHQKGSCESQASSSKRKKVKEANSSFEEEVPNIRESTLCHGEYV